ncbi:hypothetical protein HFO61_03915 [Rhizobium leguminosarum]|uniref:hypothetical protein n=1 Tax=Rhizobium leguminosarum TaxID=384 RepID=UPI001C98902B|nr:hypothetical protein [Rhizobium leguminosarum]MBY5545994.1 hypothetical protein [Rhizobium leguminosarum]
MRTEYCDDADDGYFRRRYEQLGKILPVAIDLNPGEHLKDATLRALSLNGYNRTEVAIEFTNARSFRSLSAFKSLSASSEIESLVDFLGIRRNADHLKKMLCNRETGSRALVPFFGQPIPRSHFATARRVAPSALKLKNFQRAIWAIKWIGFDPETMEMLIDQCPSCTVRLGWETSFGVSRCDSCGCDLRDFPQPIMGPSDGQALRFFVDTVDPETSDHDFRHRWLSTGPADSRVEAFELVVRIAMECERSERRRRGAVIDINARHLERAARAVLEWPTGLMNLVEQLDGTCEQSNALRNLYSDLSLARNVRKSLKKQLDVRDRRREILRIDERSSLLEPAVYSASSLVTSELRRGGSRWYRRGKEKADHPLEVVRSVRSVRNLSTKLGLSVTDIFDLYLNGYLDEISADLSSIGIQRGKAPRHIDLVAHFSRLRSRSTDGVRLSTARFALDRVISASFSNVVEAILSGELPAYLGRSSGRGLFHDLYIQDMKGLRDVITNSIADVADRHVPITIADVAMLMGKSCKLGASAIRALGASDSLTLHRLAEARAFHMLSFEVECYQRLVGYKRTRPIYDELSSAGLSQIKFDKLTLWSTTEVLEWLADNANSEEFLPCQLQSGEPNKALGLRLVERRARQAAALPSENTYNSTGPNE